MSTSGFSRFVALAAACLFAAGAGAQTQAPPDKLVVHEWGTFTSVQGSDGVVLEGLQHEEERLPPFVYSRTKVRECPLRQYGYKGLEVPATGVTQKMETPVIYFHTKTQRKLDVRVDFVKGLLTQWYPVSDRLGPEERADKDGPLDLAKVEKSFLSWRIELLPNGEPVTPAPPAVADDDPWSFARAVDAATVRTEPRTRPERMGPVESEKYIFYRGLGTFSLPVTVESQKGGLVAFKNACKAPLPFAFALSVTGDRAKMLAIGEVAGNGEKKLSLDKLPDMPKVEMVAALKAQMADALVGQGLFRDEAEAMVKTWSRAWFTSEGTRILYAVPRPQVDSLLPLSITPGPDEMVRVLVGRIEYLTPETESAVEAALRERASADAPVRDAAMARLVRYDRFLEPHVRRIVAKTSDAAVRKSGADLLATLKN